MNWREIRLKQEESLSPLATRSSESLGRLRFEPECAVRSLFERDANRILYSEDFRRLRHKTQVFFNAKNDHVCTRMEHVLYVNSISTTICRTLGLNQDLTSAIALGHDIGHSPFGHSGERKLNECLQKVNPNLSFRHEYHSLRVVDRLSTRISHEKILSKCGLNLTYEVRDGIVSHCGENYDEYILHPDKAKDPAAIYTADHRHMMPYTLGYTNGQIINTLVEDLLDNSYGKNEIRLSDERGQALQELILVNNRKIYRAEMIARYEANTKNMVEGLFEELYRRISEIIVLSGGKTNEDGAFDFTKITPKDQTDRRLIDYMTEKGYCPGELPEQITADYIAGMTDGYAVSMFEDLYWV